jgi:hypothetical protein
MLRRPASTVVTAEVSAQQRVPADEKIITERLDMDMDVSLPVRDDEPLALFISIGRAVTVGFGADFERARRRLLDLGNEVSRETVGLPAEPDQHGVPAVDMAEMPRAFARLRNHPIVAAEKAPEYGQQHGDQKGRAAQGERDRAEHLPIHQGSSQKRAGRRHQQRPQPKAGRAELPVDRIVTATERRDEYRQLLAQRVEHRPNVRWPRSAPDGMTGPFRDVALGEAGTFGDRDGPLAARKPRAANDIVAVERSHIEDQLELAALMPGRTFGTNADPGLQPNPGRIVARFRFDQVGPDILLFEHGGHRGGEAVPERDGLVQNGVVGDRQDRAGVQVCGRRRRSISSRHEHAPRTALALAPVSRYITDVRG